MSTQSEQDLSRREEMTVSSAAMSAAPWGAATVTGGVVAVGDLGLHLLGGGLGLGAVSGSVAMGAGAFFAGGGAGARGRLACLGGGGGGAGGAAPAEPGHQVGSEQPVAVRRATRGRGR